MVHLRFINQQIKQIEDARQKQLEDEPQKGSNAKVLELQRISGLGIQTADMLVREVFSRDLRDRRAVAVLQGSQVPLTRVDRDDGKRFSPKRATRGHRQVVRHTASWFENRLGNGLVEARGHAATACSIASSHVENVCLRAAR